MDGKKNNNSTLKDQIAHPASAIAPKGKTALLGYEGEPVENNWVADPKLQKSKVYQIYGQKIAK